MNCKQANEIPIRDVIESIGNVSIGVPKGKDVWYPSPFRDETKPSFKIDTHSNRWKDFGRAGKSEGTVIDFVVELKGCSVNEALSIIDDSIRGTRGQIKASFSSFLEQKKFFNSADSKNSIDKLGEKEHSPTKLSDNLEITKVADLGNKALTGYVSDRKIDLSIAKKYLKEIYFKNNKLDKSFFAVAFKNDSGAYEYRNKYLGGVIGHKDITTIEVPGSSRIAIFEGVFDFLTYLAVLEVKEPSETCIVLNSVNIIDRAIQKIKNKQYDDILLFLDNDHAGNESTEIFIREFGEIVQDKRDLFAGFKDYNEFFVKNVKT
jgi:hypothetical protein